MMQEVLSERLPRPGRESKAYRRARIKSLAEILKGNHGWRYAFREAYPRFDNSEGYTLMSRAIQGTTDDPDLLNALEEWIPKIKAEQPEWFVKQLAIDVP